jgi:hypothetical protein
MRFIVEKVSLDLDEGSAVILILFLRIDTLPRIGTISS